jgi:hypothetical protein
MAGTGGEMKMEVMIAFELKSSVEAEARIIDALKLCACVVNASRASLSVLGALLRGGFGDCRRHASGGPPSETLVVGPIDR